MSTTIEVLIGKTGESEITVNGAKGKSCQKLTEAMEQAIGTPIGERLLKPEFYVGGETAKIDIQQGDED
jgi:hypothetical protein